jgi:hypothetical protein
VYRSRIFLQGHTDFQPSESASIFVKSFGNEQLWFDTALSHTQLADGPYFATHKGSHHAWRFYGIYTNSFVLPTHPSDDDPSVYHPMSVQSPDQYGYASIAVPSRLLYEFTENKPLAGYRIWVKDLYDLDGVLTT